MRTASAAADPEKQIPQSRHEPADSIEKPSGLLKNPSGLPENPEKPDTVCRKPRETKHEGQKPDNDNDNDNDNIVKGKDIREGAGREKRKTRTRRKADTAKKPTFNSIERHDYDFVELEKALLRS